MISKIPKLPKIIVFRKQFALMVICTMMITVLTSCNTNKFYVPDLSETEAPSYDNGEYPKIAAIDTEVNDYTDEKVNELAKYSMLIVPSSILKDAENIISKVRQMNSKIKIYMYQSSLFDISRNASNNIGDQKVEEVWYYHTAQTSAGQTLEQRRVLINKEPVINMGGELTNLLIGSMQVNYKGLKNVDGIYFDNFRTRFNSNTEFQADINNDGKDESYLNILSEYSKALNKIMSDAKTLVGENGELIVNTGSRSDDETIIQGYTGLVDRNNANSIVVWGYGNPLGNYDSFVGLVDNALKKNATHIIQEDIGYNVKLAQNEKMTLDKLTSNDQKVIRVGLCTSMMGESYFMTGIKNTLLWFPEYDADIGKPKGEYTKLANFLHVREFENGCIIVNPNPGPVEYVFKEDYTDVTSGVRGKSFNIAGKDGRIFKKN